MIRSARVAGLLFRSPERLLLLLSFLARLGRRSYGRLEHPVDMYDMYDMVTIAAKTNTTLSPDVCYLLGPHGMPFGVASASGKHDMAVPVSSKGYVCHAGGQGCDRGWGDVK